MTPTPSFVSTPGGSEMLVVLLAAVLLFGLNEIPQLARASGEVIGEFQKRREEFERSILGRDETDASGELEDDGADR